MSEEVGVAANGEAAAGDDGARRARRPVLMAVDDEPAVLGAVRGDLRSRYGRDYRVMTAAGGVQAVEALRELKLRDEPVALVVSDQRMPDLSGTEVLKVARQLFPGVRTVLLTAYAYMDVAISAINDVQLDYYILKPWDPPEERLYPIIDDLLEDWHAVHHRPRADDNPAVLAHDGRRPPIWCGTSSNGTRSRCSGSTSSSARRRSACWRPSATWSHAARADARRPAPARPRRRHLAAALGYKTCSTTEVFDLAIVGAGPAGLAAAVYGASEGLSTVCIEAVGAGGQAGQSSRIES